MKNNFNLDIGKLILYLAIFTPFMPKLKLGEINLYLVEIFLLVFFPLLFPFIRLKFQRIVLAMWGIVLVSTIYSFIYVIEISSLLKVIKGIIYIPLGYLAYVEYKCNPRILCKILYSYFLCSFLSLCLFLFQLSESVSIWSGNGFNSGLSNKCFDLKSMSLVSSGLSAHGVFGDYSCLIFTFALVLFFSKKIKLSMLLTTLMFTVINLMSSVSREALVCFMCVICGLVIKTIRKKKYFVGYIVILIILISVVSIYGEYIPLVNKILYTQEAISTTGNEGNIELRIGAWKLFFSSLIDNPFFILTGYGYNYSFYEDIVRSIALKVKYPFILLPENYFVQFLWYGGVFASIYSILFWKEIFKLCTNVFRPWSLISTTYFLGLLIGSLISGSAITSDLLYCQVLIVLGIMDSEKQNNKNNQMNLE